MSDSLRFARDVLHMVAVGIHAGHIRARDVEFLYSDGPKRVTVEKLAFDAMCRLEQLIAAESEQAGKPGGGQ